MFQLDSVHLLSYGSLLVVVSAVKAMTAAAEASVELQVNDDGVFGGSRGFGFALRLRCKPYSVTDSASWNSPIREFLSQMRNVMNIARSGTGFDFDIVEYY